MSENLEITEAQIEELKRADKTIRYAQKDGTQVIIVGRLPVMTERMFATLSGLTHGEVRGQADRANLPTTKFGRKRLINVAKIEQDCIEQ